MTTVRARGSRAAFTLLEAVVSLTLFGALGYGVVLALDLGRRSRTSVSELSAGEHALRATTAALIEELGQSGDAHISVTTLADGNHELSFELPLELGTSADWGVHEPALGPGAEDQPGWRLRYTVQAGTLLRELVDATGTVRGREKRLEGLCGGSDSPPGFHVVKSGALWEITLSTRAPGGAGPGLREVFHVHARN